MNFTSAEMTKLSKFCTEHREILDAELTGSSREVGVITIKKQQQLWQSILDQINAMGVAKRDLPQLKRKWHAIRSDGNLISPISVCTFLAIVVFSFWCDVRHFNPVHFHDLHNSSEEKL